MKGLKFNNARQANLLRPCLLAGAVALALSTQTVHAADLSRGDFSINLDTTISYGVGMRVSDRDDDLVGKWRFNPAVGALPVIDQIASTGRFSTNSDDGNTNFDRGDLIFNAARITSELDIRYERYGAFIRGNYFYDFTLNKKDWLSDAAKGKAGERGRLLDAYVFGDFDAPGDRLLSLRLGRQVVSWGESTFIPGGINAINPADITALRTAGAELRDAFLPQNMLWGSIDLTPTLSMEGVVLFEWDPIEAEPVGTYFSTNDFATAGGQYAMLNFGLVPQPVRNPDLYGPVCGGGNFAGSDIGLPPSLVALGCSAAFPRAKDNKPKDTGQYGIALRYFASELNDTEFGAYYFRYHSRLPVLSGRSVTNTSATSGRVIVEYPEGINLFGLSFNTTIPGGWSVAGEVSYRDNLPIQIDDVELLFAGLSPLNVAIPAEYERFRSQLGQYGPGQFIKGYERQEMSQAQVTFTKLLGPNNWVNADQVAMVAEVGATHFWNLPPHSVLRFDGPGTDTGGGPDSFTGAGRNPVTIGGFPTKFSWGYRMVVAPTFNSVGGSPFNVTPRIAFNHDVGGISPGPGGNFIEGRKQVTVGVTVDYQAKWRAGFAYTNFFGAGINNLLSDRDFVSASISYSF
jgi:hypothetical protein